MREYELMYILDPSLDEDSTQALVGQVEDFMGKQGVTIDKTDPWGKRRLGYQIGKHWEGYYVLSLIKADAGSIGELERRLRVTDGVLRFITVRVDEEQAKLERQRARKSASRSARQQTRGVAEPEAAAPAPTPAEPVTEAKPAPTPTEPVTEAKPAPPQSEPATSPADAVSSDSSEPTEKKAMEGAAAPDAVPAEQPEPPATPEGPEKDDKKAAEPAGEGS